MTLGSLWLKMRRVYASHWGVRKLELEHLDPVLVRAEYIRITDRQPMSTMQALVVAIAAFATYLFAKNSSFAPSLSDQFRLLDSYIAIVAICIAVWAVYCVSLRTSRYRRDFLGVTLQLAKVIAVGQPTERTINLGLDAADRLESVRLYASAERLRAHIEASATPHPDNSFEDEFWQLNAAYESEAHFSLRDLRVVRTRLGDDG